MYLCSVERFLKNVDRRVIPSMVSIMNTKFIEGYNQRELIWVLARKYSEQQLFLVASSVDKIAKLNGRLK